MSNYCYEAVNAGGVKCEGMLNVADQSEALQRIKEMGLFPTKVAQVLARAHRPKAATSPLKFSLPLPERRIKPAVLAVFTRQLATLVDVGMPLLRGLRILEEQAEQPALKRVITEIAATVESGGTLSEGLAAHPKVFSPLYVNMVKAGEIGGIVEVVLRRQAEFLEKNLKIRGKLKAAMFYPITVLLMATGILALMMLFIIPRFQQVFEGMLSPKDMPAFTLLVMKISEVFKSHCLEVGAALLVLTVAFRCFIGTRRGRRRFDAFKLKAPVVGKLFRKVALARFARTFGTLLGSGVPILQALNIVKQTTGNVIVGRVIGQVHDSVKEGETVSAPLKASRIFPAMVAGMVDVGEQTGALPDMLMKIADIYDDEVDNSVSALTSLLEPAMIVFLAVIVGSIVLAMFWPIIILIQKGADPGSGA